MFQPPSRRGLIGGVASYFKLPLGWGLIEGGMGAKSRGLIGGKECATVSLVNTNPESILVQHNWSREVPGTIDGGQNLGQVFHVSREWRDCPFEWIVGSQ